jgi:hypothetical protein
MVKSLLSIIHVPELPIFRSGTNSETYRIMAKQTVLSIKQVRALQHLSSIL